jgi:hypothetical protein
MSTPQAQSQTNFICQKCLPVHLISGGSIPAFPEA